jgi:cytoskeletal protein CcmA (bactofilin family)
MPEVKPMPASSTPPSPASAFNVAGLAKAGKRVLTVGNDILLKGEIATCDRLVIEGKVDATLNDVHTVEIAETGSFKGAAHIEDAEISGLFEGDLVVRNRLVIYATGKVRGKITYGEIEIERGGELTGEIKTNNPGSQTASARPNSGTRIKEDSKVAA